MSETPSHFLEYAQSLNSIVKVGPGRYSTVQDVVTEGIEELEGFVWPNGDPYDDDREAVMPGGSEMTKDLIAGFAKLCGVEYEIIKLAGPGGGWPVVEFIGTYNAIFDMLDVHFRSDVKGAAEGDREKLRQYVDDNAAAEEIKKDQGNR